jgi:DNA (cytosine-5)-methyltransferase 1
VKHLDLFSGIGGFALAARHVGWQTVGFCEIEPSCVRILQRRFSNFRWFSMPGPFDSWQASGASRPAELLELGPDWLVIENVYHTWRRWMPELRRRLYERGYSSLPLRVRASEVGAVHHRARGWLVANADSEQLRELSRWWSREGGQVAQELAGSWDASPERLGKDDGVPAWVDRRTMLGNAIVPFAAEVIFRGINYVSSQNEEAKR